MIRGSCLCGAIRYEIAGPFEDMRHCHCSRCRKAHGAAFSTFARTSKVALRLFRDGRPAGAYDALGANGPFEFLICGTPWSSEGHPPAGTRAHPAERPSRLPAGRPQCAGWNGWAFGTLAPARHGVTPARMAAVRAQSRAARSGRRDDHRRLDSVAREALAGRCVLCAIPPAHRAGSGRPASDCAIGSPTRDREDSHAATDELRRLHPQRRPRSGAGGGPGAAWRSRWPEEEGQEWAQTAAQAAGTGTPTGVEEQVAAWVRA